MTIRTAGYALTLMLAFAPLAFAQGELQRAKDLYAAAAYEEALAVLTAVPEAERVPQVHQYQAFCLIALGEGEQARRAIEALLTANPSYQPDPVETSPRVLEAFTEAREDLLPGIARQMYLDAKAALERKDRSLAVTGFDALLRTIDSAPELAASFGDLRILADGFATLSRALPEPSPAAIPAGPASAPSAPAPTSAAAPPAETSPQGEATRPVVVRQKFPEWVLDGVSRHQVFNGMLRIRVGVDGRVESAEMIRPVHPRYDEELLRATEGWLYQPATENGVAVASELVVRVQLRPPDR